MAATKGGVIGAGEVENGGGGGGGGGEVSLMEWQGWGTSSPVPAMVTEVIRELRALELETDSSMRFGGLGGKLQVDSRSLPLHSLAYGLIGFDIN